MRRHKKDPTPTPPEVFQVVEEKPVLVRLGENFVNPRDVSSIKKIKRGLYIVKMMSEPNPEYPCWVQESDIEPLIQFFKIVD